MDTNPHPYLTFKPIRQAMSLAIDRGRIAEDLYGFAAEPTCNLLTGPPIYFSAANDGCLLQDIEGVNRLLDDNGVLDTDGDGVREYNGVPLRITYQTSVNAIRQDTQVLVRGWWRQIGIETELVQHDASVFFGGDPVADKEASYRRFFADVQMYASGSGIDPQQSLSGPLRKHIPTKGNNWALGDIARSCNSEYDRLYAQLEQTQIGPEREALGKAAARHGRAGLLRDSIGEPGLRFRTPEHPEGRSDQRLGQRDVEYRRMAALRNYLKI